MKANMFLMGLIILFSSCGDSDTVTISKDEYNTLKGVPNQLVPEYPKPIKIIKGDDWSKSERPMIYLIDSCEYVGYGLFTHYGMLTHKGNCKFCQHRQEETLHKIIHDELEKSKLK